jgi:hypothetical protein
MRGAGRLVIEPCKILPFAFLVAVVGLTATLVGSARAAEAPPAPVLSSSSPACPAGNLIEGKSPVNIGGVRGPERTYDGVAAPEGAIWDQPVAAIFPTSNSSLTWDLGVSTRLEAAWIQADANDYYTVWGSADGQSFKSLGRVEPVDGDGLRGRRLLFTNAEARFVRIGGGEGDRFYSVSEFQIFCQLPVPFPPKLKVGAAAVARVAPKPFWNDETSARWELSLAVLGILLLMWRPDLVSGPGPKISERPGAAERMEFAVRRLLAALLRGLLAFGSTVMLLGTKALAPKTARPARIAHLRRLRDRLLGLLGILAALTYINFGFFHFGNFIHDWEWTHYYVGSKYFKELSYDRLYECMATADAEDGLRHRVELRKITNLRTNNLLEPTTEVLAHPERCKQNFSDARWAAFKKDVTFFRNRQSAKRWDDLQTDHGYNGTPVWNVAGTLLANMGPATSTQIWTLAMLDPLYLLATYGIIWWAFGWRALAVALLAFATNFPSRFYWTGGSFLRWDWLFYLVASIALLKKNRPMLGGAALAYATLLRVFPGFMFIAPAMGLGYHLYKHRKLEPRYTRFFLGAALATALLVPLSLAVSGGVHGYQRFVQNTMKHKETPLTNYMGARTVLAYRPNEVGRMLKDDHLSDPWEKWKNARIQGWKNAKIPYILLVLGFLFLIGRAARHVEPWVAAALGITLIPIGVELTCYYYAFIIGLGVLWVEREEVGRWLLFLTAYTQFAAWAPFRGMPNWLDEQYTYMSLATVAVFGVIVWFFREPLSAQPALVGAADPHKIDLVRPVAGAGAAAGLATTPARGSGAVSKGQGPGRKR